MENFYTNPYFIFEPPQDKTKKKGMCARRRHRSAWVKPTKWHVRPAKTQISPGWLPAWADLSLRRAHILFCWFCHEAAHLIIVYPSEARKLYYEMGNTHSFLFLMSIIKIIHLSIVFFFFFFFFVEPDTIFSWKPYTHKQSYIYILSQSYNATVFYFNNILFLAHVLNHLFLPNESSISQASYRTMVLTICFQLFKKQTVLWR